MSRIPRATTLANEDKALAMKATGRTYREIAKALGHDHASTALRLVRRALRRIPTPTAEDAVKLAATRLERLYARAYSAAAGDGWKPERIKACLEVLSALHRIAGLDYAPANNLQALQVNIGAANGSGQTIYELMCSAKFTEWIKARDETSPPPRVEHLPRSTKPPGDAVIDVHTGPRTKAHVDVDTPALGNVQDSLPAPPGDSPTSEPEDIVCPDCAGSGRLECYTCFGLGCSSCRPCPACQNGDDQ